MNVRNLSTAIALVSVVAFAAPASAVVSQSGVQQDVRSAVHGTSGNISVVVNGDTATLFGYSNGLDRAAAQRAAMSSPGVNKVINLITDNS
jgi:osmotically-inducible protein OsmY